MPKDDMDKFEEREMKKIRQVKGKWFDRLINKNAMRIIQIKITTFRHMLKCNMSKCCDFYLKN